MRSFLLLIFQCLAIGLNAQEISLEVQTGHSGTINRINFSSDGKLLASAGSDSRIVVWDITVGKQVFMLNGHNKKVNDVTFHPDGKTLVSASEDGSVVVWSLTTGKPINKIQVGNPVYAIAYSGDGRLLAIGGKTVMLINTGDSAKNVLPFKAKGYYNALSFSQDNNRLAFGGRNERRVIVIDTKTRERLATYHLKTNQLVFSEDDQSLIAAGKFGKLRTWKLQKNGPFKSNTYTADRIWHSYMTTAVSSNFFVGGNRNSWVRVYSLSKGRKEIQFKASDQGINALAVSEAQQLLASAGVDHQVTLWDMTTWKKVKTLSSVVNGIRSVKFSADDEMVGIGYDNGTLRIWQPKPAEPSTSYQLRPNKVKRFFGWRYAVTHIDSVDSTELRFRAARIKNLKKRDDRWKVKLYTGVWDRGNHKTSIRRDRSSDGKKIILYSQLLDSTSLSSETKDQSLRAIIKNDGTLRVVDRKSKEGGFEVKTDHKDVITSVALNPVKGIAATAGLDGLLKFWNLRTGRLECSLLPFDNDNIFITEDNYYFATRGVLDKIGFRVNGQIFNYDQFDFIYNRPDIVVERLGWQPEIVAAYREAYFKRARNIGFNPSPRGFDLGSLPRVEVLTATHDVKTSTRDYKLKITGTDSLNRIERINVWVNNVPIFGSRGLSVLKDSSKRVSRELVIRLSEGRNQIAVSCHNDEMSESLRKYVEVLYVPDVKQRPNLYFVSLSVSDYRDDAYDLRYARKDGQDLAQLFGANNDKFERIFVDTLFDQHVTLENVALLREKLMHSKVDDQVIMFVSGHGLLDDKFDFYFASHDIDFKNPAGRGIPYNSIERLLDSIPARKKLFLMDACHSGEVDKDIGTGSSVAMAKEVVSGRVRKGATLETGTSGLGLSNSFHLMQELFANLSKGSGTIVISAAAGDSYALESEEWRNGVFTYCMKDAFAVTRGNRYKADANADGFVSVNELKDFVSAEVQVRTQGKQKPTSRRENLELDFIMK